MDLIFDIEKFYMEPLLTTLQLRVLHEMLRCASVSSVAETLGLTQPSVSLHLRNLRRVLEDPLFVRVGNALAPTARALDLREPAEAALEAIAALSRPVAAIDPITLSRRFRIAMTDASQVTLLPQLLGAIRQAAPRVTLEVELLGRETEVGLRDGRIDLALGFIPDLGAGIVTQRLFFQDWVCLSAAPPPNDLASFVAARHVEITSGTGAKLLQATLTEQSLVRDVALSLPGFLGLAAVLAHSDLVATLPRHTATVLTRANALQMGDCPLHIPGFAVCQYWHERIGNDQAHRWLRGMVHDCLAYDGVVTSDGDQAGTKA